MDIEKFLGIRASDEKPAKQRTARPGNRTGVSPSAVPRDRTYTTRKQKIDEKLYQEQQNPSTSHPYTQAHIYWETLSDPQYYSGSMRDTRTKASAARERARVEAARNRYDRLYEKRAEYQKRKAKPKAKPKAK